MNIIKCVYAYSQQAMSNRTTKYNRQTAK